MKHALLALPLLCLAACGGADTATTEPAEPQEVFDFQPVANRDAEVPPIDTVPAPGMLGGGTADMDGRVTLSVDRLVEERDPNNCLVMMKVENGTDRTVSAGLFAFDFEGGGETAGANLFPQEVEPGRSETAQVILPGQRCGVAQRVVGGQPACVLSDGASCTDQLDFEDGEVDFSLND